MVLGTILYHVAVVGSGITCLSTAVSFYRLWGFYRKGPRETPSPGNVRAPPKKHSSPQTPDCGEAAAATTQTDTTPTPASHTTAAPMRILYRVFSLAVPVTLIALGWGLALQPDAFPACLVPATTGPPPGLNAVLPLHPTSKEEAFRYGVAREQLRQGQTAAAVALASEVAGRPVTEAELADVGATIDDITHRSGLINRAKTLLSFANILSVVGAVGVCITATPFACVLASELRIDRLLWAAYMFLYPLWRPAAAALSAKCLLTAIVHYKGADSSTGVTLGLFSLFFFHLSSFLNGDLFGLFHLYRLGAHRILALVLGSVFSASIAVGLQSTVLGYATIVQLIGALGFFADSEGLTTFLGFRSRNALASTTVSCGLLNVVLLGLRAMRYSSQYTKPFESPISVFATAVFHLGQLILYYDGDGEGYAATARYIGSMALTAGFGAMFDYPGMVNVAFVYAVLFGYTEYCCMWRTYGTSYDRSLCFTFGISCGLYATSLLLNRNPQLVTSFLSMGMT